MTIKLHKDGKTVIVDEGSRNHDHFTAQGFIDPSTQAPEPTPEPEIIGPEAILEPEETQKPARRPRKKKTDEG